MLARKINQYLPHLSLKQKKKRKIFIIGKGVSFDTGGLNLKTGVGMSLMKKDMGGAANAIGLAKLLSKKNLNAEVNLLLCLVENSVSDRRDWFCLRRLARPELRFLPLLHQN